MVYPRRCDHAGCHGYRDRTNAELVRRSGSFVAWRVGQVVVVKDGESYPFMLEELRFATRGEADGMLNFAPAGSFGNTLMSKITAIFFMRRIRPPKNLRSDPRFKR